MASTQADAQAELPAYFVAEVEVIDPEAYKLYASRAASTAERYGGRYLVRGEKTEALEGEAPKRIVITAWRSIENAKRWYQSPEYSDVKTPFHWLMGEHRTSGEGSICGSKRNSRLLRLFRPISCFAIS